MTNDNIPLSAAALNPLLGSHTILPVLTDPSTASQLLSNGKLSEALSDIPEIKIPEYKVSPEIQMLLEGTVKPEEREAFILRKLDEMDQWQKAVMPVIFDSNKQARKTNGQVIVLSAWNQAYGNKLVKSLQTVEKHEELLAKTITVKDAFKYLLASGVSAAAGILVWIEFFQKVVS